MFTLWQAAEVRMIALAFYLLAFLAITRNLPASVLLAVMCIGYHAVAVEMTTESLRYRNLNSD